MDVYVDINKTKNTFDFIVSTSANQMHQAPRVPKFDADNKRSSSNSSSSSTSSSSKPENVVSSSSSSSNAKMPNEINEKDKSSATTSSCKSSSWSPSTQTSKDSTPSAAAKVNLAVALCMKSFYTLNSISNRTEPSNEANQMNKSPITITGNKNLTLSSHPKGIVCSNGVCFAEGVGRDNEFSIEFD